MKRSIFILTAFMLSAFSSISKADFPVGSKYTTSHGYTFTRVNYASFGPSWQAPDGTIWSDSRGQVLLSNTVETCNKIGGQIPTADQIQKMMSYFPGMSQFQSDPQDVKDLEALALNFTGDVWLSSPGGMGYIQEGWVQYQEVAGDPTRVPYNLICVGQANSSANQVVTPSGSVFTRVKYKNFPEAWQAPNNGRIWSISIGEYTNVHSGAFDTITDSPASKACASVGGVLPSMQDFRTLIGYFSTSTVTTAYDEKAYLAIGGGFNGDYWTSSAGNYDAARAVGADPYGDMDQAIHPHLVRCISPEGRINQNAL